MHDANGEVIYINQIGRELLATDRRSEPNPNYVSESFQVYRSNSQIPYPIDELPSSRALAGETVWLDDLEIHHPDRVIALEVWATPILDEQSQVVYAIGHCLTLEITESMLIDDVESTIRLLHILKERGIQFSIDDFGTGYSSLSYLHCLPVDNLKVDRSFINQIQSEQHKHQIVETIAALGKQLDLDTIAEGIETPQQLEQLQRLGYKFGQGYLFSKPLSQESAEALLASNS